MEFVNPDQPDRKPEEHDAFYEDMRKAMDELPGAIPSSMGEFSGQFFKSIEGLVLSYDDKAVISAIHAQKFAGPELMARMLANRAILSKNIVACDSWGYVLEKYIADSLPRNNDPEIKNALTMTDVNFAQKKELGFGHYLREEAPEDVLAWETEQYESSISADERDFLDTDMRTQKIIGILEAEFTGETLTEARKVADEEESEEINSLYHRLIDEVVYELTCLYLDENPLDIEAVDESLGSRIECDENIDAMCSALDKYVWRAAQMFANGRVLGGSDIDARHLIHKLGSSEIRKKEMIYKLIFAKNEEGSEK